MTDFADWGTPAENARQISLAGVPLLTGLKSATLQNSVNIPANTAVHLGTFQFQQIGYDIALAVSVDAACTQPGLQVEFDWSDPASGLQTAQERWQLLGSNAAGGQQYMGTGPTKGGQLDVTITNFDPSKAATITTTVLQNSRVWGRDDWRQLTNNAVPTFNTPLNDAPAGWLMQASPNIGSGVTSSRWGMLYAGSARLYASGSLPFDLRITSFDASLGLSPNTFTIYEDKVTGATGGFIADAFALPRTSWLAFITNNGGSSQIVSVNVIRQEMEP